MKAASRFSLSSSLFLSQSYTVWICETWVVISDKPN